jgi:VWFA-related protein
MLRRTSLLFSVVLVLGMAVAQQPEPGRRDFRAEARLVLVPAVVHDSSGKHVSGLTKEQFRLLQDGKQQAIAVFEEVKASRTRLEPEPVAAGEFSNTVTQARSPRALTVIALDLVNTAPMAVAEVKHDLLRYIADMAKNGDLTALATFSSKGTQVVYDFTTDPAALAAAVGRIAASPNAGQTLGGNGNMPIREASSEAAPGVNGHDAFAANQVTLERQLEAWAQMQALQDSASRMQQSQIRRDTLQAMRSLATALGTLPGRKSLIWVTGGLPYGEDSIQVEAQMPATQTRSNSTTGDPTQSGGLAGASLGATGGPGARGSGVPETTNTGDFGRTVALQRGAPSAEALNDFQEAFASLNNANVSVYPVDARRLVNSAFESMEPSSAQYSSRAFERELVYNKAQQITATFENFAIATGGRPCYGRGQVTDCFREAVDDGNSYYMLGYYVPLKTDEGWHKLEVRSGDKGLRIRARTGFNYSGSPTSAASAQSDVSAALSSPVNALGIPIRGSFLENVDRAGKKAVKFELRIPWEALTIDAEARNHLAMDIAAVAFDDKGVPVGKAAEMLDAHLGPDGLAMLKNAGLRYRNFIEVPPGNYTVRFVVRDDLSGRIGSVQANLTAK